MQKNKEIGEYRGAPIYERLKKVKIYLLFE